MKWNSLKEFGIWGTDLAVLKSKLLNWRHNVLHFAHTRQGLQGKARMRMRGAYDGADLYRKTRSWRPIN